MNNESPLWLFLSGVLRSICVCWSLSLRRMMGDGSGRVGPGRTNKISFVVPSLFLRASVQQVRTV